MLAGDAAVADQERRACQSRKTQPTNQAVFLSAPSGLRGRTKAS
jgi:hypothetical protein